jgi:predicted nucleotidyltransferase
MQPPAVARHGGADDDLDRARAALERLRDVPPLAGQRLGLVSLIGSRAYGLARPDSDYDFRGFYVAPSSELLGLGLAEPQLELKEEDLTVFELDKFVKLAAKANPNVLETLWAPPVAADSAGELLRSERQLFLSQRLRSAYSGFANSHLLRLKGLGPDEERLRRRHTLHLFRVLDQGSQLLREGELSVRLERPQELLALTDLPREDVLALAAERDAEFRALPYGHLPERPDFEALDRLVLKIRYEQIERERAET